MVLYADALIAVLRQEGSRGTQDMMQRARVKGLKVYVHLV